MESLEKRQAQRAKERADAEKEREPKKSASAAPPTPAFSVVGYLSGTPEAIQNGLLNDADFAKLEPSEKIGKKRAAVLDALTTEKNRRAAGATWDNNAG